MHSCNTHPVIFLALTARPSPATKGLFSTVYPYDHQHSICSCCSPLSSVLMLHGGAIKTPPFDQAVGLCFVGISANSPWLWSGSLPAGIPYIVYFLESRVSTLQHCNTANACCYWYHKYPMKLGHILKKRGYTGMGKLSSACKKGERGCVPVPLSLLLAGPWMWSVLLTYWGIPWCL